MMWSKQRSILVLFTVVAAVAVGCGEEPTAPATNDAPASQSPESQSPETLASIVFDDSSTVEFVRVADDAIVTVREGKGPNALALASADETANAGLRPSEVYKQLSGNPAPSELIEAEREMDAGAALSQDAAADQPEPGETSEPPGEPGPETLAAALSCSDTWEWFEDHYCSGADVCYTCITGNMSWYTKTSRMTSTAGAYRGNVTLKLDGWKSHSWQNMYSHTVHEGYCVQATLDSWGCVAPYICEKYIRTRVTNASGDGYDVAVSAV
jgi:hypothetical protein